MKVEKYLDWKHTVKLLMALRGINANQLARDIGTSGDVVRGVLSKGNKGRTVNNISEHLGISNDEVHYVVLEVD